MTVNEYCKYFRTFILKITLKEFTEQIKEKLNEEISISSVTSFENARSSNLKYLRYYYQIADEENQKIFKSELPL